MYRTCRRWPRDTIFSSKYLLAFFLDSTMHDKNYTGNMDVKWNTVQLGFLTGRNVTCIVEWTADLAMCWELFEGNEVGEVAVQQSTERETVVPGTAEVGYVDSLKTTIRVTTRHARNRSVRSVQRRSPDTTSSSADTTWAARCVSSLRSAWRGSRAGRSWCLALPDSWRGAASRAISPFHCTEKYMCILDINSTFVFAWWCKKFARNIKFVRDKCWSYLEKAPPSTFLTWIIMLSQMWQ